jgi:hypothetical protein
VRKTIATTAFLALALAPGLLKARVANEVLPSAHDLIEDLPLVQWDGNEEVAQQQTPVVPPAAAPVTTPAPAAPTPAPVVTPAPAATPEPAPADKDTTPDPSSDEAPMEDEFSIGDIPVVETLELTEEKSRKALDIYVLVRDKYKDAALEEFENLQDFVDQSPQGKAFETDVKSGGFADVAEWNTTITTLSFAYDNSIDDQTGEIRQQIEELKADTDIAQDMRDRMITALTAMIPSDNNKKVLEALKADVTYGAKLKLLETEAE